MPLGYEKELLALQKAGRLRQRLKYDPSLVDCASNDYLGFASSPTIRAQAVEMVEAYGAHGAGASMMVNGYHQIHEVFEKQLAHFSCAPCAMVVGSGFLANIAIIEAMIRRDDLLVMDSEFHASGVLASRLVLGRVKTFRHNDAQDLHTILSTEKKAKRIVVAVEGIYSMSGDRVSRDVIETIKSHDAYMLLDEAHSVGVVGEHLGGALDYYHIPMEEWMIKMGTLGKALGSYGAYIVAYPELMTYIQNRAKSVIYSTALSLFDTAFASVALSKMMNESQRLSQEITTKQSFVKNRFKKEMDGLIFPFDAPSNERCLQWGSALKEEGFLVGAIRPPTVPHPMLRVIFRTPTTQMQCEKLCDVLERFHG